MTNSRKRFLTSVFGLLAIACVLYGVSYFLSLCTMRVDFQNINKVLVYDSKKLDSGKGERPIKEISYSGQKVKLRKGQYTLKYEGAENYQSLFVEISLKDKNQTVDLRPGLTDEYLNKQLDGELTSINQSITQSFPKSKISLYVIQRGKLYLDGEWYGTTLRYKGRGPIQGQELFQTDTLRIVLKKEGGKWVVKTKPPNVVLNKYTYKDVPVDVLRAVNALPIP